MARSATASGVSPPTPRKMARTLLPSATSEEVPDRGVEPLSFDVPKGHVDAGYGGGDAVAAEAAVVAVHVVEDVLGVARVHANDGFAEGVDGLFGGAGVGPVAGFADALGAVVGGDADD